MFLVLDARQKFLDVKNTFRKLGIKYSMLYPGRLRIELDGKPNIFNTQLEAEESGNIMVKVISSRGGQWRISSPTDSSIDNQPVL